MERFFNFWLQLVCFLHFFGSMSMCMPKGDVNRKKFLPQSTSFFLPGKNFYAVAIWPVTGQGFQNTK